MKKNSSKFQVCHLLCSFKKQILLFHVFLFWIIQSYTQITPNITVVLSKATHNENFYWPTELYDQQNLNYDTTKPFTGVPGNLTRYIIKTFDLQPAQGCYENYKRLKGEMPLEVLKKLLRDRDFNIDDTIKLSKSPIRHFISFLVGYDKNSQINIIGDANNNHDFSDDTIFRCDTSMLSFRTGKVNLKSWISEFQYQYSYNGNVINRKVSLQLNPLPVLFTYSDSIQQRLYLSLVSNESRNAQIRLKEGDVFLTIEHSLANPVKFDNTSKIILKGQSKYFYYTLRDSLYLFNKLYLIDRLSDFGDTLYLKYIKNYKKRYGIYPGAYVLNIESVDINTKRVFNLRKLQNKYILLDFWGSWCKPCLASIPELVKFSKLYDSSILSIVSIAEDSLSNLILLKRLINKNNMQWTHLFEEIRGGNSKGIAFKFKVYSYPTQILINPEGKIIFRSDGENKLNGSSLKNLIRGKL